MIAEDDDLGRYWWRRVDSNHRHRAYETPALPTELRRQTPRELETGLVKNRPHDRKALNRCQGHIE